MHRRIERRVVIRSLLGLSAALVAAAAACGGGPTEPGGESVVAKIAAPVAQAAAAVTGQDAKLADEYEERLTRALFVGVHKGFFLYDVDAQLYATDGAR